ncbi:MAG: SDR family NAD(P)-dependent oxidoreductase [Nitrospirae bacterium]|nr:SDR family NAD(P)-dependent oxidoreductase [Nitrospirota bacterium]
MNYFSDKIILITGANGGLGTELVRQLHVTRAKLILTDIASAPASNSSRTTAYIPADIRTRAGCEALAKAVRKVSRIVDILINNAGLATAGDFVDVPDDEWEAQIEVNLLAAMRLTRLLLPGMIERRSGHIVNISSLGGHVALPKTTTYATSKWGLRGFGMALHGELAGHNIKVSNAYPSFTRTAILDAPRFGYEQKRELPAFMVSEPSAVASKILRGVARGQLHIFPSADARLVALLVRLFPGLNGPLTRLLLKFLG